MAGGGRRLRGAVAGECGDPGPGTICRWPGSRLSGARSAGGAQNSRTPTSGDPALRPPGPRWVADGGGWRDRDNCPHGSLRCFLRLDVAARHRWRANHRGVLLHGRESACGGHRARADGRRCAAGSGLSSKNVGPDRARWRPPGQFARVNWARAWRSRRSSSSAYSGLSKRGASSRVNRPCTPLVSRRVSKRTRDCWPTGSTVKVV